MSAHIIEKCQAPAKAKHACMHAEGSLRTCGGAAGLDMTGGGGSAAGTGSPAGRGGGGGSVTGGAPVGRGPRMGLGISPLPGSGGFFAASSARCSATALTCSSQIKTLILQSTSN